MLPVALAIPLSAERVQSKQPAAERIKWADGEALELLTEAVDNWLAKKGPIIEHSPDISLKHYCGRVEVPYNTLRMYVSSKNAFVFAIFRPVHGTFWCESLMAGPGGAGRGG